MSEKLKPCPFCGGEAELEDNLVGFKFTVQCKECFSMTDGYFTSEEAIAAWNRRVSND